MGKFGQQHWKWELNVAVFSILKDKILQTFDRNGSIQVTNDGATILKAIGVDNPAAKVLVGKNLPVLSCLLIWENVLCHTLR